MLVQDIKLANRLGFTIGRTKMGVIDEILTPVTNWREIIEMTLPVAEEYNFKMCPGNSYAYTFEIENGR